MEEKMMETIHEPVLHFDISNSIQSNNYNKKIFMDPGQLSGTALGYELDDQGFESQQGMGISFYTTVSRPTLGPTQPPIQWVAGACN
jgi:hypothetical protein